MTELTTYQQPQTALTIADEQHTFTDMQVQALTHIGVQNAAQGDLAVFFHVVKRTGLDPFARQIYMIGRVTSENVNGEWVKTTKQTIQTGIDGYRLIGRRAAARSGDSIAVGAPEWAHEDGTWRPVWRQVWGSPIAARFTIHRAGEPFTAVALFDEYAQTKRSGDLTQMWAQRPAGQIAKCAEALAWRMAFPQDLSDVYTDEEMQHADPVADAGRAPVAAGRAAVAAAVAENPAPIAEPQPAPEPPTPASDEQVVAIEEHAEQKGIDTAALLATASVEFERPIADINQLTADEADRTLAYLSSLPTV